MMKVDKINPLAGQLTAGPSVSQNLAFALCMISYLFGGTVATLMSVYLPVAVPELLGGTVSEAHLGEVGAYIGAAFLYGWGVGGLTFGVVSDRIGRVKSLALVTGLYGIATLLTVFVPNWYALIACRFAAGMGIGGVLLISTVYLSEIWPVRTRPIALGILAVAFPIGIVTTGGLNVFFANWRDAFWLGIIPIGTALAMIRCLPESAAWASSRQTYRKQTSELWDADNRPNLIIGTLIFGSVLIGLWGIFSWIPTWVQSLLPVGQNGQQERGITMMLLGSGGIVGGVLSGFLIKSLGVRKTLIVTFLGCASVSFILFLTNRSFSPIVYIEMACLSLFFGISQGALSGYIPQLFPTVIRATAAGFCFNIGRFFTATSVFFVGAMVAFFGGLSNALLTFSVAFLVSLAGAFFSRETKINE
ncbi:MFS transporter [Runella sp. CRIBMP]|uniref:MFS transporter n=1 Tax=Runella sp. CRIBMP TaxID=2683261 RepID=UPI001412CEAB|nr:MFS transporter [Runella sp. CRIBMP]NBB21725.1 MFS transporter [Runella sp. CRIBMP]